MSSLFSTTDEDLQVKTFFSTKNVPCSMSSTDFHCLKKSECANRSIENASRQTGSRRR